MTSKRNIPEPAASAPASQVPDLVDGCLPVGIHDCTIEEVVAQFGQFQGTDKRVRLAGDLVRYYEELTQAGIALALIVDGSFITDKDAPGDIDLILVLPEDVDFNEEVPPFKYNASSMKYVRKHYGFDLFPAPAGSVTHIKVLSYFQRVKGRPGQHKGVLRVSL